MKPLKSFMWPLQAKASPYNPDNSTGLRISRRHLKQVMCYYEPLSFESFSPTDHRFSVQMHHVLKNYDRLWVALRTAASYVPPGQLTVADLGTYPGSLLRLLRRLLPPERCRLVGVGLMISDEFRQAMAEDCGA